MAYTREIELDASTNERLVAYIDDELMRAYAERGGWVEKINSWQIDYDAEPSQIEGTFPFKGSATLIIPLAAITVEAIHARTMTTAFALSQFVSCKPKHVDWEKHARPVERFLDSELMKRIGIYNPVNSSVLEIIKYGTGVARTGYCKITKTAVRELEDGKEEEFTVTVKQNATVDSVPLQNFLMPFAYQNPQEAAWCGEELELTPYEVRQHETGGLFKKGTQAKLAAHYTTHPAGGVITTDPVQENQEKSEAREPVWPLKIKCVLLYLGFDIDKSEEFQNERIANGQIADEQITNNFDKEIVVYYHPDSKTILSCRYNWNQDLRRDYHTGVYFPVEHRWPGIGVCKQVEQFQREITTQHRQRIDNATLANCRMIKVSSLSKYGPDEPIFPGKMWFVDNINEIDSFALGEIYPSSYSNEQSSLLFVQQRTGINEVSLGMPQVGTPGTATSDLARVQEGNKKHDFTYGNIKHFISSVTQGTILNIKQFGPKSSLYYEVVENGNLVKEFFMQDFEKIKEGMLLEIVVAGQQDNKLLDRQNAQQISQMLVGYYDSMLGLAQAKGDQQLMQRVIEQGMIAGTEAMKQILELMDLKNVDRMILKEVLENGGLESLAATGPSGAAAGNGTAPRIPATTPSVPANTQY